MSQLLGDFVPTPYRGFVPGVTPLGDFRHQTSFVESKKSFNYAMSILACVPLTPTPGINQHL